MFSTAVNVLSSDITGKKGGNRRRNQRSTTKSVLTTGWQLEAANTSEWGVEETEPIRTLWTEKEKESGFINEEYIHTLSPEERQLHEWKKTQRNLGSPVKVFMNLYDLYPKQEPSKKLLSAKPVSDGVLPSSIAECAPEYSDDAIPDTGMRRKLDLICMKEKCFQMALEDDLKSHASKRSSSCHLKEQAETFNIGNVLSNFTISLSDGLVTTLLPTDDKKFNRVICATKLNLEDVKEGLKKNYDSFKQIRKLNSMDVTKFVKMESKGNVQKEAQLKSSNFFEIFFENTAEGQHFCDVIGKNEKFFSTVMKYPSELDKMGEKRFYSMKTHWFHDFSNKTARIWIKNPVDVGHAEEVLSRHMMDIDIVDKFKKGGSRTLDVCLRDNYHEHTSNPAVAEHVIRRLLEANGIELDSVSLGKCNWRHLRDVEIRDKINEKVAETCKELNIAVNHSEYNWSLDLFPPTKIPGSALTERKATITFADNRAGKRYTEEYRDFHRSGLNLAKKDDRGVRFSPVFTVEVFVPKPFRIACHTSIQRLDEEVRKTSDVKKTTWVRVKDNLDEEKIIIEGWPEASVTEVLQRVKQVLKPTEMDCKDDGSPNSASNLLHGCGLALVKKLQSDSNGDLMISMDRLNERICFWGDKKMIEAAIDALEKFLQEPKKHLVNAEIRIREPRFLPLFKEVLSFNGEKALSDAVGGASIRFMKPDRLLFKGSVEQYDSLQELLDEEHGNTVDQAKNLMEEKETLMKECPACLMAPRDGFTLTLCGHVYCLACVTQLIRVALEAKRIPITCCSEGCDKLVALQDIMSLLLEESMMPYQVLFRDRLEPLCKATLEKTVQQSEHLMFCPKPDCKGVLNKTEKTSINTVACCECKEQLCGDCLSTYHPRWSCEDNREIRENEGESIGSYLLGGANARRCPNKKCNILIEKDKGCDHMCCSQCKVHFCWHCPSVMGETAEEVYKHLFQVHGRLGQEFAHLDANEEGNNGVPPPIVRRRRLSLQDI